MVSMSMGEVKRHRKENELDCIKTTFYTFHRRDHEKHASQRGNSFDPLMPPPAVTPPMW
jgi:hypothetical protein